MFKDIIDIEDGGWTTVRVKVIQLWDNDTPSIRQVGIVGDETGIVKFVSWEKSNLPLMETDVEYEITDVVVSSYNDRLQIALNAKTTITRVGDVQTELPIDHREMLPKQIPTV